MLRSGRQSCSWRGLRRRGVDAVIANQFSGIAGLSAGRGKIAPHTRTDALQVSYQSGVVEAIAVVGFSRAGCLSLRCKAFESVELLQNQTQLILFMSRCRIAATIECDQ